MSYMARHYGTHTIVDVSGERGEGVASAGRESQLDGWLALLENVVLGLCETVST